MITRVMIKVLTMGRTSYFPILIAETLAPMLCIILINQNAEAARSALQFSLAPPRRDNAGRCKTRAQGAF
jgi:hypothetical protein